MALDGPIADVIARPEGIQVMRNPDTIARTPDGRFDNDASHPEPTALLTHPASRRFDANDAAAQRIRDADELLSAISEVNRALEAGDTHAALEARDLVLEITGREGVDFGLEDFRRSEREVDALEQTGRYTIAGDLRSQMRERALQIIDDDVPIPTASRSTAPVNSPALATSTAQTIPTQAVRDDVRARMEAAYTPSDGPLDLAKEDTINRTSAYLMSAAAADADSRVASILLECDCDGGPGLMFYGLSDSAGNSLDAELSRDDMDDTEFLASNMIERRSKHFPPYITPVAGNDGMYRLDVAAALADRP